MRLYFSRPFHLDLAFWSISRLSGLLKFLQSLYSQSSTRPDHSSRYNLRPFDGVSRSEIMNGVYICSIAPEPSILQLPFKELNAQMYFKNLISGCIYSDNVLISANENLKRSPVCVSSIVLHLMMQLRMKMRFARRLHLFRSTKV